MTLALQPKTVLFGFFRSIWVPLRTLSKLWSGAKMDWKNWTKAAINSISNYAETPTVITSHCDLSQASCNLFFYEYRSMQNFIHKICVSLLISLMAKEYSQMTKTFDTKIMLHNYTLGTNFLVDLEMLLTDLFTDFQWCT